MNPISKLLGFAAALAAVFGLATVAGEAIDPDAASGGADETHANDENHVSTTTSSAKSDSPGGLAIAQDGYRLDVADPDFAPGERRELTFRIIGPDGQVVRNFNEEHQRDLHLIVVRRDLTGYQHLHPEMGADGTWTTPLELPEAGTYRAYADFSAGETALTLGADLTAAGDYRPAELPAPKTTASTDGYDVELEDAGEDMLEFTVTRDGEPVTDLQPYLGAQGHLVAIRGGDLAYLHVHPQETQPGDPTIPFHAELPTAGSYRMFLQFRHEGEVRTVAFTREVTE